MKKIFEAIGIITLVCVSFVYTEKTVNVVKEYDEIMIAIKEANAKYQVEAKDATIVENTIIPGINGKKIHIDKSYNQMRRYGKYHADLLVYREVEPFISLNNHLQNYVIGGNPTKNMVSIIFLVTEQDDISNIVEILDKKNVKANFFIDGKWLEQHNNALIELIQKGHNVGNLGYNRDYTDSSYGWIDTFIKKVGKQKVGFCYNEKDDMPALQLCALSKNYTIRPNITVNEKPLITIKEEVKAGSIIALSIQEVVEKELPLIINYLESKGLQIATLESHLSESLE